MLCLSCVQQALEYAVKAQAELMDLQEKANQELEALQTDYQQKLNAMQQQLEMAWRNEKTIQPGVQVKVYPHK